MISLEHLAVDYDPDPTGQVRLAIKTKHGPAWLVFPRQIEQQEVRDIFVLLDKTIESVRPTQQQTEFNFE